MKERVDKFKTRSVAEYEERLDEKRAHGGIYGSAKNWIHVDDAKSILREATRETAERVTIGQDQLIAAAVQSALGEVRSEAYGFWLAHSVTGDRDDFLKSEGIRGVMSFIDEQLAKFERSEEPQKYVKQPSAAFNSSSAGAPNTEEG